MVPAYWHSRTGVLLPMHWGQWGYDVSNKEIWIGRQNRWIQVDMDGYGYRYGYGLDWCILTKTGWWFGTMEVYCSIYWEFHHPNWRTHIFQRGRYNHQPDFNGFMMSLGKEFDVNQTWVDMDGGVHIHGWIEWYHWQIESRSTPWCVMGRTGPHWLAIRRMDKVPTDGVNGQLLTMPCQVALDAQRERSRCGTLEHWSMLDGLSHADPKMVRWWNWDFMQICRFKAPNAIAQVMSVRRYEQAFERQEDKWPVGLPGRHQRNVGDQLVQAFPGRIGMSQTIFSSTHLRRTWHQVRSLFDFNWRLFHF